MLHTSDSVPNNLTGDAAVPAKRRPPPKLPRGKKGSASTRTLRRAVRTVRKARRRK